MAILVIPMSVSLIVPTTNAHTPPLQIPMYPFINVAPNPAGLGQSVTIGF